MYVKKLFLVIGLVGVVLFYGCGGEAIEDTRDINDSVKDEIIMEEPLSTISIDEVLASMPTNFEFEDNEDWDFTVFSESGFARIDFTGTKNDLEEISLITSLNINGNEEVSMENSLIVATLLSNVFPDHDLITWLLEVIDQYNVEGSAYKEEVFAGKTVISVIDENGILYLTITLK